MISIIKTGLPELLYVDRKHSAILGYLKLNPIQLIGAPVPQIKRYLLSENLWLKDYKNTSVQNVPLAFILENYYSNIHLTQDHSDLDKEEVLLKQVQLA